MAAVATAPANGKPDFTALVKEKGYDSLNAFGKKVQYGWGLLQAMQHRRAASNHPYRADVAKQLGVEPEALTPFFQGKPMAETSVTRMQTKLKNGRLRVGAEPAKKRGRKVLASVTVSAGRGAPGKRRNSLKRQSHDLRQAVRDIVNSTNVAVMRGERYVVNVPTLALYHLLTDYAEKRGIKTAVVLHPDVSTLFD